MTSRPGTEQNPLRVCVIGAGPSAFYATEALFKAQGLKVQVDMFDRLPNPFGLVRGGVAPDHQNIKTVTKVYFKIAENPGFRFFGNVRLGRDIQVTDLQQHYHQVIYGFGCESDTKLGVPGEELGGVHSATEFVGWYNGHPDYADRKFDLANAKRVAVVGNGNVSMDTARVLLKDPNALAPTDIAEYAVEQLKKSNVKEVVLLGRRGPAQSAFSSKEMEEIQELPDVAVVISKEDAAIDAVTAKWLESAGKGNQRNAKLIEEISHKSPEGKPKRMTCRFCVSPIELIGKNGKLSAVRLQHAILEPDEKGVPRPKAIDKYETLECELIFKAIGYRGIPIQGVPFDQKRGTIPNTDGRVLDAAGGKVQTGYYTVGWVKRGPSGLVGDNSRCSKATADSMIADQAAGNTLSPTKGDIVEVLKARKIDYVSWQDWLKLDQWEVEQGKAKGKVRLKTGSIAASMKAVHELRAKK